MKGCGLAWCSQKSLLREVVSLLLRKSLHLWFSMGGECRLPCAYSQNTGLPFSFSAPLLTPRTQSHVWSAREEPPAAIAVGFSPSVSQDQALPEQLESFTLLLSWLSTSYCPSNTALLALTAVFRCFSQMMSLLSPAASVICSIFYSRTPALDSVSLLVNTGHRCHLVTAHWLFLP